MIAVKMSISSEKRLQNLDYALSIFFAELGNEYYKALIISKGGTSYDEILPTTWQDLLDGYYLREVANGHFCFLTALGWLRALEVTGTLHDADFTKSLGKISKALKDRVKGRHDRALASSDEIALEAGVPVGLVQGVIDSGLLRQVFNRIQAEWACYDDDHILITIPINFGLKTI